MPTQTSIIHALILVSLNFSLYFLLVKLSNIEKRKKECADALKGIEQELKRLNDRLYRLQNSITGQ